MIFLIDDNKFGQMEQNYKFDFTSISELYPKHITWLQTLEQNFDMIIKNASCILIHDSIEPKEEKEWIVANAIKNKILYCIFSNGFAATTFHGESIKAIKKDRFYNNLIAFVNKYRAEGELDLKLLSLGQNYDIERASILQDRLINGTLLNHMENFDYEVAFPSGSQDYKDLLELVYISDPIADYSEFEDKNNSKDTSAEVMRIVIVNMTKNIKRKYE